MNNFMELVDSRMYNTSRKTAVLEYIGLSIIGIIIPLVLQHPQVLVGSLVNFVLIMAAINVAGWKKLMPIIVLPSISALLNGYLFGVLTIYLVYMLPFIWIGNAVLVMVFKQLFVESKRNFAVVLPIAAILKAAVIFLGALMFIGFSIVPAQFAKLMGLMQLITALTGGVLAFSTNLIYKKYYSQIEK